MSSDGYEAPATATATAYYRYIDEKRYEELRRLLDVNFVHYRPDRTIEGPDRFVQFMGEERPRTDTVHHVTGVFRETNRDGDGSSVAVEGSLRSHNESNLFDFVDIFALTDEGLIRCLRTYTS